MIENKPDNITNNLREDKQENMINKLKDGNEDKFERKGKEENINSNLKEIKLKSEDDHKFKVRSTRLDMFIENSAINLSEFKGFLNLFIVLTMVYMVFNPISNFLKTGSLISPSIKKLFYNFYDIPLLWIFFHLWSYFAFLVQILILKDFKKELCNKIQYGSEFLLFIIGIYFSFSDGNYGISHQLFIMIQTCIYYFKMHSYFLVNRDYRNEYLDKCENKPLSSYPNNIIPQNFFYFLCAPTLVYQDNYPRSDKFRFKYFLAKSISGIICLFIIFFLYFDFIQPSSITFLENNFFENINKVFIPITFLNLVFFFMVFECICPAYAEITCFGDRFFYDDFWNSTDQEEFSRKWNRVVHCYLYNHVYLELIKKHRLSPKKAGFLTFLYSAFFHELLIIVMLKVFVPFLFLLIMFQIPMIHYLRPYTKGKNFGNLFFWFGLIVGTPLNFVFYNTVYLKIYG